jgi:hypothetical protein
MKSLQIFKSMSVFSKRSMLACMIAVGVLSLNSCDKDSMDSVDISSVEASRPPILTNVPPPIISDMKVFAGMTINSQNRVEKYLQNMTPEKAKTIILFKDINIFGNLSQDKQAEVISEVLGFDNINEYIKYAKFMEDKRQHIADYVKINNIPSYQLANELTAVKNVILADKKNARVSFEEIPDSWIDLDAYTDVNPACQEYAACVNNKVAEGVISTGVATGVGAFFGGPVGATAGFVGGWLTTGFTVIYSATFGDCSLKRQQCKRIRHSQLYGDGGYLGDGSEFDVDDYNPNKPRSKGYLTPGGIVRFPR